MTIIKCKICGGDLELSDDKTIGMCEYCGSTITLPKVSDEQRLALFNRGNHFRRIGEFDKALAIYENIVREDDTDAEAHWCCALSRFGIEYVEDPNTFEYLPTCHRASFDSFLEDVDFKAALENSDGLTRRQYQKDAAKIAEVQRGILATSQNEEPYDVFICYKETDDQTKERTKDSVDAQEIYYQLTQEGYRVFFSRITLEDKAGTEYEPYIFAALNSAKVMIVIGSKPEYFNAVWVKNEWSRFLSMMRKDRSKVLLPCYKGMDPYDLPEQLSVLQSYDMTKIGFVQDLLRGIKKIINKNTEPAVTKETSSIETGAAILNAQTSALLKRGYMALEDKDFKKADDFFEQVLNNDPECGEAYWGKVLCKNEFPNEDALAVTLFEEIQKNVNYKDVEFLSKPVLELVREADKEYGVFKDLSDGDLQAIFQKYNQYKQRFQDGSKYYQEIVESCLDNTCLKNLIHDRDLERAVQYEDKSGESRLSICSKSIRKLAEKELENEVIKKEKAEADVINEENKIRSTIAGYLARIPEEKIKIESEMEEAQKKAESDYRAALESNEAEYQKALEKYETDYQQALEKYEADFQNRLMNFEQEYENHVNEWKTAKVEYNRDYSAAIKKRDSLKDTIVRLENERTNLKGLFTGKKKAELDSNIELLSKQLNEIVYPIDPGDMPIKGKEPERGERPQKGKAPEKSVLRKPETHHTNYSERLKSDDECRRILYELRRIDIEKKFGLDHFGKYPYSETGDIAPIRWRILDVQENMALIISEMGISAQKYNDKNESTSWEKCTLRKWLNNEYLRDAFSISEQESIMETRVDSDNNPSDNSDPGKDTKDKIFLLSLSEAETYFSDNADRIVKATPYAKKQGAFVDSKGRSRWWLRTRGIISNNAGSIGSDGHIDSLGNIVNDTVYVVRPAMWISLK